MQEGSCHTREACFNGANAADVPPAASKKRVTEGPNGQAVAYPVATPHSCPVLGLGQYPSSATSPGQAQSSVERTSIPAVLANGTSENGEASLANGHVKEEAGESCGVCPVLHGEATAPTLPGGGQGEEADGVAELVHSEKHGAGALLGEKTGPQAGSGCTRSDGGEGGELNNIVPFVREEKLLSGGFTAQHVSDPVDAKRAAAEERRIEALARWVSHVSFMMEKLNYLLPPCPGVCLL